MPPSIQDFIQDACALFVITLIIVETAVFLGAWA